MERIFKKKLEREEKGREDLNKTFLIFVDFDFGITILFLHSYNNIIIKVRSANSKNKK